MVLFPVSNSLKDYLRKNKAGDYMALKPSQRKAAELMAMFPNMTFDDIATEVNVNKKTLWQWRKKEEFILYYQNLCKDRFRELEGLAVHKLKENALKGNQKAIEYILNYCGYQSTTKIEAELNTDINLIIEE